MIAVGHRPLERSQLLLDGGKVGGALQDVVAERPAALRRRALIVEGDARPLLPRELAAFERDLAGERPQQRGLAGPVRPRQRESVAPFDLERDAVEEDVA